LKSMTETISMDVDIECFPCFLRQVVIALKHVEIEREHKIEIIKQTLEDINNTDIHLTPAHTTTLIHRRVRTLIGDDPFKEVKKRYNDVALSLYDDLKELVTRSADPLMSATRLAVAGNSIDFGIYTEVDIHGEIKRALDDNFSIDHFSAFREQILSNRQILYLLDNAGEIVFDRILIETLISMNREITAIVKGSPVINDATMDDAMETGLTEICTVKDNGSDAIGTILQWASDEFKELFASAPFVISKGQGNFETLISENKNISFLFQAKCEVVARRIGVPRGGMIILDNGMDENGVFKGYQA